MILPWNVDVPQDRIPFANWLMIAVIIAVFAWQVPQFQHRREAIHKFILEKAISGKSGHVPPDMNSIKNIKVPYDYYMLNGWTLKGLCGHMWLHGSVAHLIGNLIFLWIFGNAVCAKIGNITYVPIYIIFGIFAGMTHLLFSNIPALGASGAINGVVGMYLVLFPMNSITCYYWGFSLSYLRELECSSYVMILLWFAYDIFGVIVGAGKIGYFAHIGGFITGFVVAVVLLKIKYITMTSYEKSLLQVFADFRSIPQAKVPPLNKQG
jgi:membrane associated rhomboid family serine protease